MIKIKRRIFDETEKSLRQQTQVKILKPFVCPNCQYIIVTENNFTKDTVISCPNCEQKNIFKIPLEKPEKKYEESNKLKNWLSQASTYAMIIGFILTLISIALLLFYRDDPISLNLILTLLLIGGILQFFIIKKEQNISMKITLVTVIYIILLFLIFGKDIELLFSLIFLGILLSRALLDVYLPESLRIRMNLFLSIFFIIFVISIIKRILSLVNI